MGSSFVAPDGAQSRASPEVSPQELRRLSQRKGRQARPEAVADVVALIGERPQEGYRRDALVEYLHKLQDRYSCLDADHLSALARLMDIGMAEVFEVASFYHHFEVVRAREGTAQVSVRVCDSAACEMAGARTLLAQLKERLPTILGDTRIRVCTTSCVGRCEQAPAVLVHQNAVAQATVGKISEALHAGAFTPAHAHDGGHFDLAAHAQKALATDHTHTTPACVGLAAYVAAGGYSLAQKVAQMSSQQHESVLHTMEESGLRGLGGAGFPCGRKWRIVRAESAPRLLVVNIDEGEPGTFKDRTYLERDPHRFLEGVLIACTVAGIEKAYIYLRDEYHGCRSLLDEQIKALQAWSVPGCERIVQNLELRRGAGAYICGEESAMLESIEGRRAQPRMRPPYIAQVGLFGRPTLAHNFETLYWVRDILERGAAWFSGFGRRGRKGLRSFSVSGRVNAPGVKLAPAGITAAELIDEYCGGMLPGHRFYAYLPGGACGGILPASMGDIALDFDTLQPHGCFIGSAAVLVLSDHDRARDVALNIMRFFVRESCGQCTPCRVGTGKAAALMQERFWDRETLEDLAQVMGDASICGLGQAAPNPVRCVLKYFSHEVS